MNTNEIKNLWKKNSDFQTSKHNYTGKRCVVFFRNDPDKTVLYPATSTPVHCRIFSSEGDKLGIRDHLLEVNLVDATVYSDFQDEAGSPLGGDFDAVQLALAKLIG